MIAVMFRKEKRQFNATHDYEPFGVEIPPYNESASNSHKFTGHERDAGTDYDYMHFRFYASSMGRFLKPDNMIPNAANPQSWNLYSYVNGNPVNFNDPGGHEPPNSEQQVSQTAGASSMVYAGTTASDENQERRRKLEQPKKVAVYLDVSRVTLTGEQKVALQEEVKNTYGQAGVAVSWASQAAEADKTVTVWGSKQDYLTSTKEVVEEKVFTDPTVMGYVSPSNRSIANVFLKESATFTNLTGSENIFGKVLGRVTAHELGHTLGIKKHDDTTFNIMMSGHTAAAYKSLKPGKEFLFTKEHAKLIREQLGQ